jgi:hypothetical protein
MFFVVQVVSATAAKSVFQKLVSIIPTGVLLACLATLVHADDVNRLVVRDAWSRATPPGTTVGAAYFVIENRGPRDRLLRASSPIAKQTEMHVSAMGGGVMRMQPLEIVEVGRRAIVTFESGGKHVMLIGLRQPLKAGDTFPLTLTFEKSGAVQTTVRVFGLGQSPGGGR